MLMEQSRGKNITSTCNCGSIECSRLNLFRLVSVSRIIMLKTVGLDVKKLYCIAYTDFEVTFDSAS